MSYTYKQLAKKLERPVNGRRRVGHNYTYCRYAEDKTTIEVFTGQSSPFMTIAPNDVVTLNLGDRAGWIYIHNRVQRITGLGIYNNTRDHGNKQQAVRVCKQRYAWKDTIPYFDGLQLELTGGYPKILNMEMATDKTRVLDKEGAAKVRRHLSPLVKLFKVSMKIGALDEIIAKTTSSSRYFTKALYTLDELVAQAHEPNMAHVEALYIHGLKHTKVGYWGDIQKKIREDLPENAYRVLRIHAYKLNGLYTYEVKE
jgi:hypothetical protein